MPENLEKFTSPDQSKKTGKLTPEEIKEMVKKFKEEHEGLLPEYFSLPGEEREEKEEEREYSEETILAYEIKKFLEKIRPEIENENLIKNAEEQLKSNIKSGQNPGNTVDARWAVSDYTSFKQSGLWSKLNQESQKWIEENIKNPQLIENAGEYLKSYIEAGPKSGRTDYGWDIVCIYASYKQSGLWSKFDQEFQDWVEENIQDSQLIKNAEELLKAYWFTAEAVFDYVSYKQSGLWLKFDQEFRNWVEENIKNPQLIKNAEEDLKSYIESGQKPGGTKEDAWHAIRGYTTLSQFQKILEEQGKKKEIAKESQKAMHPEKKLPPMPEEKAF
jgi:hypothetical protein